MLSAAMRLGGFNAAASWESQRGGLGCAPLSASTITEPSYSQKSECKQWGCRSPSTTIPSQTSGSLLSSYLFLIKPGSRL